MSSDSDRMNGTGTTLPITNPRPIRADTKWELPCYTVLVHGVNDLGETYEAQERGLCEGLNARLGRCDLKPATYAMPSPAHDDALVDDPDAVFFKRTIEDPDAVRSPIIPFYWGFREEKGQIRNEENQNLAEHGQWLDRFGNRLDRNGAKEGGPFANATSSLPDLWADGFKNKVLGFLNLNHFADPTHPLLPALPRHYMVLAAKRLAVLVKIIRKRWKDAPINLVAHSQGCMIALLSQAFLIEEGQETVDCIILNNPPYSFEEYNGWLKKAGLQGMQIQSTWARVETFKTIVNFVTAKRDHMVSLEQLKDFGVAADTWDHAKDRDNRQKVYLYFSPDDRTVGMSSPEGIGWQGVPEEKLARIKGQEKPITVLSDLGERFFQRVFTTRLRKGKPTLVGEEKHDYKLWEEGEQFWGQDLPWLRRTFAMAKPGKWEVRKITAEPLPQPFKADLGEAVLTVSPVDAAIAVTNDGLEHGMSKDGQSKEHRPLKMEDIPDPRPHPSLGWGQEELSPRERSEVEHLLNQGKDRPDHVTILHAWPKTGGILTIQRHETYTEARGRWQHEKNANSFHSGIVANSDHSRLAHAYDIAIGLAGISREEVDADRHAEDWVFVQYLWAIADWRFKDLIGLARLKFNGRNYAKDDISDKEIESILRINADYYATGILSSEICNCPIPKMCVVSETLRQAELGQDETPHSPLTSSIKSSGQVMP